MLDVQVIGVPNARLSEEIMAWIILKENKLTTAEDIHAFCDGTISKHKIPRYIEFTGEYPMTASGKIQKFKLKEIASQCLEQ